MRYFGKQLELKNWALSLHRTLKLSCFFGLSLYSQREVWSHHQHWTLWQSNVMLFLSMSESYDWTFETNVLKFQTDFQTGVVKNSSVNWYLLFLNSCGWCSFLSSRESIDTRQIDFKVLKINCKVSAHARQGGSAVYKDSFENRILIDCQLDSHNKFNSQVLCTLCSVYTLMSRVSVHCNQMIQIMVMEKSIGNAYSTPIHLTHHWLAIFFIIVWYLVMCECHAMLQTQWIKRIEAFI